MAIVYFMIVAIVGIVFISFLNEIGKRQKQEDTTKQETTNILRTASFNNENITQNPLYIEYLQNAKRIKSLFEKMVQNNPSGGNCYIKKIERSPSFLFYLELGDKYGDGKYYLEKYKSEIRDEDKRQQNLDSYLTSMGGVSVSEYKEVVLSGCIDEEEIMHDTEIVDGVAYYYTQFKLPVIKNCLWTDKDIDSFISRI